MTPPPSDVALADMVAKSDARVIKKGLLGQLAVIIVAIVGTALTFYFTTKSDIRNLYQISNSNTKNIEELTKSVNNLTTKTEVLSNEPTSAQKQMDDMNKRMDRIEAKQDQIYEILINMQNRK
jgi:hypothetical protein